MQHNSSPNRKDAEVDALVGVVAFLSKDSGDCRVRRSTAGSHLKHRIGCVFSDVVQRAERRGVVRTGGHLGLAWIELPAARPAAAAAAAPPSPNTAESFFDALRSVLPSGIWLKKSSVMNTPAMRAFSSDERKHFFQELRSRGKVQVREPADMARDADRVLVALAPPAEVFSSANNISRPAAARVAPAPPAAAAAAAATATAASLQRSAPEQSTGAFADAIVAALPPDGSWLKKSTLMNSPAVVGACSRPVDRKTYFDKMSKDGRIVVRGPFNDPSITNGDHTVVKLATTASPRNEQAASALTAAPAAATAPSAAVAAASKSEPANNVVGDLYLSYRLLRGHKGSQALLGLDEAAVAPRKIIDTRDPAPGFVRRAFGPFTTASAADAFAQLLHDKCGLGSNVVSRVLRGRPDGAARAAAAIATVAATQSKKRTDTSSARCEDDNPRAFAFDVSAERAKQQSVIDSAVRNPAALDPDVVRAVGAALSAEGKEDDTRNDAAIAQRLAAPAAAAAAAAPPSPNTADSFFDALRTVLPSDGTFVKKSSVMNSPAVLRFQDKDERKRFFEELRSRGMVDVRPSPEPDKVMVALVISSPRQMSAAAVKPQRAAPTPTAATASAAAPAAAASSPRSASSNSTSSRNSDSAAAAAAATLQAKLTAAEAERARLEAEAAAARRELDAERANREAERAEHDAEAAAEAAAMELADTKRALEAERAKAQQLQRRLVPKSVIIDQLPHIVAAAQNEMRAIAQQSPCFSSLTLKPNPCIASGNAPLLNKLTAFNFSHLFSESDPKQLSASGFCFAFHGTSSDAAASILCGGFDTSRRGSKHGQMHGEGEYFGTMSQQGFDLASLYARSFRPPVMLVTLVVKIHSKVGTRKQQDDMIVINNDPAGGTSFCVPIAFVADHQLPHACRCGAASAAAAAAAAAASSSDALASPPPRTYRVLVELDQGWAVYDADFTQAVAAHVQSHGFFGGAFLFSARGFRYKIDLDNMTQTNLGTGKVRAIKFE